MVIKGLALTRRRLLVIFVACTVLAAGILMWQIGEVTEATILTPYNFYDDFSGDLSQWTNMRGTWTIESEELSQSDSSLWEAFSVAGSSEWTDYVMEAKVKLITGIESSGGVLIRFTDTRNYYTFLINPSSAVFAKRVGGTWYVLSGTPRTHELDVWYQLKVNVSQNTFRCYVDNILVGEVTDTTFLEGRIGLRTKQCHAHFDDLMVSGVAEPPSIFSMNVRAGVTQIILTCTWNGLGNIAIELVSPTTTYYESDMSIYEKTRVSFNGTTTTNFNIKRAALSISAPGTAETWKLYLNLGDVKTYEVSVETS